MEWARPLWIALYLGGLWVVVYWGLLRFGRRRRRDVWPLRKKFKFSLLTPMERVAGNSPKRLRRWSELYVVTSRKGKERRWPVGRSYNPPPWILQVPMAVEQGERNKRDKEPTPNNVWLAAMHVSRSVRSRVRWEMPLFWTAAMFSMMNVVNLGVQGLDLGRWLRMMQRREFDLKAEGTLRWLAGVQSVASFLLLALSAYVLLVQPIGE